MSDLGVIDHFLQVFSLYIDSGFGLLRPEVSYLTATLVVLDITLAGLYWALGGHEDVVARLVKKTLYVGTFAFILTNFAMLSSIVFRSFAGLGLVAGGSRLSPSDFLQPGRLAGIGVDAGHPILAQIGELAGFPGVFLNLDSVVVLFLAWLIVIVSFFVLSVQLFVTLIEFKLTTLAGFVLIPFALWNRTAFLAERVLGNVVSSGIKVLVLALIVGIGSTIFSEFHGAIGAEPSLDQALAIMLASLALLGLGIFGPSIASGLVSGGPQLGAGAAAGTAIGVAGLAVAGGAAAAGGARLAMRAGAGVRSASSLASGARDGVSKARPDAAAAPSTGHTGGESAASSNREMHRGEDSALGAANVVDDAPASRPPDWARRLHRRQQLTRGVSAAAHVVRGADHGGSGASPNLREEGR
jgi:type IV secretion system protein TrbL